MKSPLVDVLRQASDSSSASKQSESAAAESPPAGLPDAEDVRTAPDPGELQLMDPMEIMPIDGREDMAGVDSTAEYRDITSLEIANDDTAAELEDEARVLEPPARPRKLRATRSAQMPRLGLYSPLICLTLAAAATGCYFVYQSLGGWYQNSDLKTLSSQFGSSRGHDESASAAMPESEIRFKLLTGPQNTASSKMTPDATRDVAHVASRQPSQTVQRAGGASFDAENPIQ